MTNSEIISKQKILIFLKIALEYQLNEEDPPSSVKELIEGIFKLNEELH